MGPPISSAVKNNCTPCPNSSSFELSVHCDRVMHSTHLFLERDVELKWSPTSQQSMAFSPAVT